MDITDRPDYESPDAYVHRKCQEIYGKNYASNNKERENKMITWEKKSVFKSVIKGIDEKGHTFYRTFRGRYICILDVGGAVGWSDESPEEALKWAQKNTEEK